MSVFSLAALAAVSVGQPSLPVTITVYRGAKVWNGDQFSKRTLAVANGRFVTLPRNGRPQQVIDLTGKFIVPPYGNAHHHITNPTPTGSWTFIEEGVFYVWNPNSIVLGQSARDYFATVDTIDVAFSQGGITEPRGHPEPLYVDILSQYVYKGMTQSDFVGNAFHYGRTQPEIDQALDRLKSQQANFVKAYLLFSEQYSARRSDKEYEGNRGLDPANIPYLVSAARRRKLPVYFHVETRSDLLTATRAGAAVVGHLPGYRIAGDNELALMKLTREDAAEMARNRLTVVPTYGLAKVNYEIAATKPGFDAAARDRHFAIQRDNLRSLSSAGVRFLTGTDRNPAIFDEVEHWVSIGGMSGGQALKATLATGRHMFPKRRLGCFDIGCEADFLVLGDDPSQDIRALRTIERIVKAGVTMIKPPGLNTNG